jgi:hypothetical protein
MVLAIWFVCSVVVAVLVSRCIHYGSERAPLAPGDPASHDVTQLAA